MKPRKKRERPSLAKLVEFCDGDEDAAMWMARTWSDWGARDPAHARTFYRVTIQGYFEARREEFEAGSKEALFAAIAHAARMDTPIPEWAREPFRDGWHRYRDVVPDRMDPEESTLGGAFGITRPAGLSAASGRLNNLLGGLVWSSAVRMQREGKTLPEAFKQIACDLDVRGLIEFYAQFNGIRAEDAASLVDERILRTGKVSPAKVKAVYYEFANGIKEHEKSRKAR